MYLGYNTNGLAHHDLFDAVELLAEIGYGGVAITIDHHALAPNSPRHRKEMSRLRRLLERLRMRSTIETGARFLLDRCQKHEPTLLSEDRHRRIDFYKYAIRCAAELGSDCVSLWSGTRDVQGAESGPAVKKEAAQGTERLLSASSADPFSALCPRMEAMDRLTAGLREVLYYAAALKVTVAFEPEPGMFIDTMPAFEQLLAGGADIPVCPSECIPQGRQECLPPCTPSLQLTLNVGHLHCQGETPIAEVIRRWAPRLVNVHVEDMRAGRHEHLMFGEGEIDFPPVLAALHEVGYAGGVYVELSRHSHVGPDAARQAFEFLQPMISPTR